MISFFAPFDPPETTSQQAKRLTVRGGHARVFTSAKGKQVSETLDFAFCSHAPSAPLTGPLAVFLGITWKPKQIDLATKAKRARFDNGRRILHTRKPDCDNAAKMILDSLQRLGYFVDDKQIANLTIAKRIGFTSGVDLVIRETNDYGDRAEA